MEPDEFLDAVKKNDAVKVDQLLEKHPSLSSATDKNGVSAIFLALYRGNRPTAETIASRKRDLDIFEAASLGKLDQLMTLIGHNPSLVDSYSPDGFTALALAAYLGQKGSVEYLIEKGADLNALAKNETGYTALTGAVSQNHNEIAKLLVGRGAMVNHCYEGGFTPLMHAAYAGNMELVQVLLDSGADPNAKNSDGNTPLTFAREKGHASIVELLLEHGAS